MRKHIVISSGSLKIGGVERLLIEYLNNVDEKRYKVTLILMSDFGEKNVLKDELNENINVKYLKSADMIKEKEGLSQKKKKLFYKIKYKFFLIKEKKNTLINLKKHLKTAGEIDIFIDFDRSLINYRNEVKNIPKIIWIHASLKEMARENIINIDEMGKILNDYEKIVVICKEMREEIVSLYPFLEKKLVIIYNPFDFKKIKEKAEKMEEIFEEEKKLLQENYIVSVSRLDKAQKDFPTLIRAFKLIENKISEKLYIIGDGDGKQEIENLVSELKLNNKVILLGEKKNPFIWMKNSKLFVHSSKFEGFGLVLVEAMILGKVVVSSDCPVGPREILEDGDSGLLFSVGNEMELSEKIITGLHDQELKKNIKKNMDIRIIEFEIGKILEEFYEMIENTKI